ncbi:Hypothetical predicted protein [Octopus vulgaris]|uniref:Uncharacterized protein n=1 Tax=Octopus vulgaris TaxID=6645 RepID=A0AA36BP16_OCTVU|nr:Hypothetical predicted protein [Octopus vulgaris]
MALSKTLKLEGGRQAVAHELRNLFQVLETDLTLLKTPENLSGFLSRPMHKVILRKRDKTIDAHLDSNTYGVKRRESWSTEAEEKISVRL